MRKILANLSTRQRITIVAVTLLAAAGLYSLVQWRKEADFKPLFTGLAAEDAGAVVQKLRESGAEYRLAEGGGAVLVPSARVNDLRLTLAAAGLPKSGRAGFELFDKMNLGATEFTEHINYRRALEGELERSVMALAEVEQARVHLTFARDSVFLDAQQPAKASVLVRLKPGARLSPQNVQAVNHLVASAVEGLSPDAVSVLDMNGNLLGRPRRPEPADGAGPSEATLEFRHRIEADLLAKINATLEPLLGAEKFRAGASVDCDFTGGEQSEELYDPARSVMLSSQRSEDSSGAAAPSGVPGTASTLPRPTSRPASSSGRVTRVTENITYQSSRTVKRTRLAGGAVKKMSLAILVDQGVTWERNQNAFRRVLVPPTPEKLKAIRDLVAGVTGFSAERGDQITVESLPFESTLNLEPPPLPQSSAPTAPAPFLHGPLALPPMTRRQVFIAVAAGAGLLALAAAAVFLRRRRRRPKVQVSGPAELPSAAAHPAPADAAALPAAASPAVPPGPTLEAKFAAQLAERSALQQELEAKALNALKIMPVITKTAEVFAKHLRETAAKEPEVLVQILRNWIREEDA